MQTMQKEHKLKTARHFVEVTQELIDAEGIANLSVRKIADKAGMHNSTIYLYFENVDRLLLLASLHYFNEYTAVLAKFSSIPCSPKEKFLAIWDAFGKAVFAQPQVFYNFFFGRYSENLTPLFTQYYELFPEEKSVYSEKIEAMYYGKNIRERCLFSLLPLLGDEDIRFSESNIELVNDIIVGSFHQLLEDECSRTSADPEEPNRRLLDMVRYITGID